MCGHCNNMSPLRSFAALAAIWTLAIGADFDPTCVGDITEFPNCETADDFATRCSDMSKEETIKCFCKQELLNAYVGWVIM